MQDFKDDEYLRGPAFRRCKSGRFVRNNFARNRFTLQLAYSRRAKRIGRLLGPRVSEARREKQVHMTSGMALLCGNVNQGAPKSSATPDLP